MTTFVDLELDDEEQHDMAFPAMTSKPRYPYGTTICLTGERLAKLKLDPACCKTGDVIDLRAFGEITSISKEGDGRVEIQLQKIALENESAEEPRDYSRRRSPLHDNDRS